MYPDDVVQCPFCQGHMTLGAFEVAMLRSRGWSRAAQDRLYLQGFSPISIERAKETGIAVGWLLRNRGQLYRIECLYHRIGYEQFVDDLQLFNARADLKPFLEEAVKREVRFLVADAGCQHWADYRKAVMKDAV